MNILIPIVGRGERLKSKYNCPKPLVEVAGKSIIEHCVSSLGLKGQYIFVVRNYFEYDSLAAHYTDQLKTILRSLVPDCKIITTEVLTQGPASSALLAKSLIDTEEPLLITNCDQITLWNSDEFVNFLEKNKCDGCVTTYPYKNITLGQTSPYSFIQLDSSGHAVRLEEKRAISYSALNGIHFWKQGSLFVSSAQEMINNKDTVNNEFYVSKTYNYLISQRKKIIEFKMNENEFFALGDIEEVNVYLEKASQKLLIENK